MSLSFSLTLLPWRRASFESSRQLPLRDDFTAIFERDPAAHNWLEVLCCYPGLHAIALHRLAHALYQRRLPFFPRGCPTWLAGGQESTFTQPPKLVVGS